MKFQLDINEISLETETAGLRLISNTGENQVLTGVALEEAAQVLTMNYKKVKEYYQDKLGDQIPASDLQKLSLKIVIFYHFMYQSWRKIYEKEKDRDLAFLDKDFAHPYTTDAIIAYFSSTYPNDYAGKCEIILGMSTQEFRAYEKERKEFYDMW